MLENKNIHNLKSENLMHFPNVNSLMKISLGLIFFTMLSTALVYAETTSVDVDGISFDISYTTTGMTIVEIESDTESNSLIFSVDVTDSIGILDVEFQRSFFDSIYDGTDDLFFILADGDESVSEETQTSSQSRSLTIEVPPGTQELEIIGSVFNNSKIDLVAPAPVAPAPVAPAPVAPAPVAPAPVAPAPVAPAPVAPAPVAPAPVAPAPVAPVATSMDDNACGPGTVLKDDVCVLDERCGPGTVLKDDVCVLDSTPLKSTSSGNSKELIMGVVVAFVIAGIVGIIFAIISKANRNKN